ncbi:TPA: hypothetical protein ACS727_001264 [Providencia alcalifaciens]
MKSYAMHSSMLYEYTVLSEQAKDAAKRRITHMKNLALILTSLAEQLETPIDEHEFINMVNAIKQADTEMKSALKLANQAAKLCGKSELNLAKRLKS